MIEIKNLELSFGARKIFNGANLVINRNDRIGLVGSNGAGKSTLLKILSGDMGFDSGEIAKPKYATIGYLPQEEIVSSGRSLYEEAEASFEDILALRQRLAISDEIVATADPSSEEYSEALWQMGEIRHKLEDAEESKMRPRIETILRGLGFAHEDMTRDCSEFSGGWQMRIALAKLLLQMPALLMLDEPTNHLDIESVAWLEDYLCAYRGAVILVSHDRTFLNKICNRTAHVHAGAIDTYTGDYDDFERLSIERKEQIERAAANLDRKIAKTEKFIERFRYKASKAAQVQSRIKMLDKVERIETESEESNVSFSFPPAKRCGQVVLKVNAVKKSFGELKVLDGISFQIERGQRVGIVGVNGAGKSTLAKIIASELAPDDGDVELGLNVSMSFFAQHQSVRLNPQNDVLTEATQAAPIERKNDVRSMLGSFLFRGDDVFKKVSVLSGGEKNRLALAKMLLKDFNFLLLDEPTNHLDMNSKAVLQKALKAYGGTYMIVSHDRSFLDDLVDEVIELSPKGMRLFKGNLSDYVEKIKNEGKLVLSSSSSAKKEVVSQKDRRRMQAQSRAKISSLKRETERLEQEISKAESDLAEIEQEMASPEFFKRGAQCSSTTESYNALKLKIEKLYFEWEQAQEAVSVAEAELSSPDLQ